jgi:hypothetical protein
MYALWIHQTTREIVIGSYFSEKPLGFVYKRVDPYETMLNYDRPTLGQEIISVSTGEWDYWAEYDY